MHQHSTTGANCWARYEGFSPKCPSKGYRQGMKGFSPKCPSKGVYIFSILHDECSHQPSLPPPSHTLKNALHARTRRARWCNARPERIPQRTTNRPCNGDKRDVSQRALSKPILHTVCVRTNRLPTSPPTAPPFKTRYPLRNIPTRPRRRRPPRRPWHHHRQRLYIRARRLRPCPSVTPVCRCYCYFYGDCYCYCESGR